MMDNIYTWCKSVSSNIRYKKDREAVYEELLTHMIDKINQLQSLGLSYEEAANHAMEDMGDPNKLAESFRRIHKPYMGWLLVCSRWLLIGSILFYAFVRLNDGNLGDAISRYLQPTNEYYESIFQNELGHEEFHRIQLNQKEKAKIENYSFQLRRAVTYQDENQNDVLHFTIHVSYPFYAPAPEGVEEFISAIDSNGKIYSSAHEYKSPYIVFGSKEKLRLSSCEYEMWIQDIDLSAQWIDIRYQRFEEEFQFRIPLSEVTK